MNEKFKWLKRRAESVMSLAVDVAGRTRVGRHIYTTVLANAMRRVQHVTHQGVELVFAVPNALTEYRANTFSTKEPETLEWLDTIPHSSVVWDIGANVGLYSC